MNVSSSSRLETPRFRVGSACISPSEFRIHVKLIFSISCFALRLRFGFEALFKRVQRNAGVDQNHEPRLAEGEF